MAALIGNINDSPGWIKNRANGTTIISPAKSMPPKYSFSVLALEETPNPKNVKNKEQRITDASIERHLSSIAPGINPIAELTRVAIRVSEMALLKMYVDSFMGVIKRLWSTFCCFSSKTNAPTKTIPSTEVSDRIR